MTETKPTGERADLLAAFAHARYFLRHTTQGLTDEQANTRTTASELTLAGLIKHVTGAEVSWTNFIEHGGYRMYWEEEAGGTWSDTFTPKPGETLAALLDRYTEVAARTDHLIATLPSLDLAHPLPEEPWFEKGSWTARRVLTNLIAETAQHAGHADIIRESLDGQKSMG
ncbi:MULTISPECIES: DinB family protein [unclassified Crossiella]|uniref:DinB family protein n=1 Tax=unclassified Crossiella TaxID=2620835 RepID=UPI001FFE5840|nr:MULTISPECIES: DinB family protein [unclassified Crossiella]MCK2237745.1 DinB family protein [Crossiella sp. S99.2]MCK2255031.1 DinB family protein [Crossiella sp. S99.1]